MITVTYTGRDGRKVERHWREMTWRERIASVLAIGLLLLLFGVATAALFPVAVCILCGLAFGALLAKTIFR